MAPTRTRPGAQNLTTDFDTFVAGHYDRLVGLLRLRLGPEASAEEHAQECLIRLLKNWDRVQHLDNPWAWLATVAVNQSRSHWRRRFTAKRIDPLLARASHEDGADGLTELLILVSSLPPRQRQALLLRHYARLSVRETADVMGCAEGTVKSLTSRAIDRLRIDLRTELEEPDDED